MANLPAVWALIRSPFLGLQRPDERSLPAAIRRGDTDAFRHVFDRHALPLHRFLRDLLGDEALAEEATQETFVRAFQRLPSLDDDDRLSPWLFGIARNVSLELRKARLRHREEPLPDDEGACEPAPSEAASPEALLLLRESGRALEAALAKLPVDRRAALLLRGDHGLSYDEISRVLGWSLAKVKVEIHRARAQLRALLEEEPSR